MGDKRTKKRLVVFTILMAGLFILLGGLIQKDSEAAVQVLETNVTEAGEDKVLVGVQGTFYSSADNEMLALMNEVRKEAYDEQLEWPKGSGKHLGIDYEYVPLKWSYHLENIARIRAAECSMLEGHSRPSGAALSLEFDGIRSYGEVIAWNTDILKGIWNKSDSDDGGSWYSEKKYYIDPDDSGHVTGHYTSMIDPDNVYVGISAFKGDYSSSRFGNYLSIVGEFSYTTKSLDQTFVGIDGNYIQKLEVYAQYVTLNLDGDNVIYVDDESKFDLKATVNTTSTGGSYNCPVYTPATWSIDDDSIADIDPSTGKITAKKSGSTTVRAEIDTGADTLTASAEIIVLDQGVTIDELEAPETITVNTGTKPDLPKTVKANLSNGEQIDVVVSWAEMNSGYYDKNSYNYWQDTEFDVEGTLKDLTVKQHIKVIAQIKSITLSTDSVTTDSGVKPELPEVLNISLTNGMSYTNPGNNWTWDLKDEYKSREGGDFEIEGSFYFNKTKTATFTLHVNPATVTNVEFKHDGEIVETDSGVCPEYPKATVTWSNTDVTEEDIEWVDAEPSATYDDPSDPVRKYYMRDGGDYDLTGIYNEETTNIGIHVNAATADSAAVKEDDRYITVNCGEAPVLPLEADVFWSNGDVSSESVTWDEISEEAYNVLEGNNFEVTGLCFGKTAAVEITALPADIVSIDEFDTLEVPERVNPTDLLPETATINWSNDTSSELEVTWDEIDESDYSEPGTFTVEGYIVDMHGNNVKVTNTINVNPRKPVSIELKDGQLENDTCVYSYSKTDITGEIDVHYDNGEVESYDITPSMITVFDADSTESSQVITITYTEDGVENSLQTTIYLVKRNGITVTTLPDKTEYIEDECEELDITGIEIYENFDNGTVRKISSDKYSVDDFSGFDPNPSQYGDQEITVSLYGFSDTFNVKVSEKTLEEIKLYTRPDKLTYVEGQEFDPTGIVINGTFDNGKTYELDPDEALYKLNTDPDTGYIGEDVTTDTVGRYEVFVLYPYMVEEYEDGSVARGYQITSFYIDVIPKVVDEIDVYTEPSKTVFPQNDITFEDYNFSDGELVVNYNDGDTRIVKFFEDGVEISGFDITTLGGQTVTVSYGEKTTTFETMVNEPQLVSTTVTAPTKSGYAEGETLELDGAKIVFTYDNGLTDEIDVDPDDEDIDVAFADDTSITDPLTGDSKTLVVIYKGTVLKTLDGEDVIINISQRVGIEVVNAPSTVSYPEGTPLSDIDLEGIQLVAVFEDETTSPIPEKDYALAANDDYDSLTLGKKDIYVEAYGFETSFEITIREKRITSITIMNPLDKTEYAQGQPIDMTGLMVLADFDNGTSGYIDISTDYLRKNYGPGNVPGDLFTTDDVTTGPGVQVRIVIPVETEQGTRYVASTTMRMYVYEKVVQSISITRAPAKLSVPQNLKGFSYGLFSDGQLTAECNCDFTEVIDFSNEEVELSGLDITRADLQEVTVTYGGQTTTFEVEVTEPVVTTKSVTAPSKTSYNTGEELDMSGARFVVTLDNGLTESFDLTSSAAMAELKDRYGYEIKAQFVDEYGNVTDASSAGTKTLVITCSKDGVEEKIDIPGGAIKVVVVDPPKPDDGDNGNNGNGNNGNGNNNGNNGNNGNKGNSLVNDEKGTRYIKADGSFAKSEWVTINGKKYYFNSDSYAASNEWRDGKWISADGSCTYTGELIWKSNATGWWVEDTEGWYPTSDWQKIDGIWYYFNSSGYMASNEWYNGYWFNSDGSWDPTYNMAWRGNSSGWWIEDISGWWPSASWQKIDGYWYYFDGSGYMVTNTYVGGWWIGADGVCY